MSFFSRGGIFSGRDSALSRRGALGRSLTLPKGGVPGNAVTLRAGSALTARDASPITLRSA